VFLALIGLFVLVGWLVCSLVGCFFVCTQSVGGSEGLSVGRLVGLFVHYS
jgi:hypothetical protein